MILDTNALSAWAEGDRAIEPVLRSATEMMIPAVVLGEFEFGIRQSRHYRRYADWLHSNLGSVEVVAIDRDVAHAYGAVRLELKKAGTPIPINDTWIAAIARQRALPVISRDVHFDAVAGIQRVSW
ncbi:MAG: type II toxin-antitoxin system VapC family toxin [Planctomycetia bacterium]|nr:type II toxin-antitoxin system VapC family toxin [Planctomycetia bacterium]